jgi:membrane protease YdiL (CAAX protease family)
LNLDKLITVNERPALSSILIIIGFLLIGMVVGNLLAGLAMVLIVGLGLEDLLNANETIMASPNGWWAMIIGQAIAAICTFIIPAIVYWKLVEKKGLNSLGLNKLPDFKTVILVISLMLLFAPFNGWVQSINEKLHLPSSLSGLETFMKDMEQSLAELTKFFTNFSSVVQLFFALVVIAAIAGIGEELIFRGLLQRKINKGVSNHHLAIWVSATIFSAIHIQFYGFFPRMFLGAMFGYFFYYSGNLWVPIIAHIFNNALAVVMIDLVNQKKVSPDLEKLDTVPWYWTVLSLSIFFVLFYRFIQYQKTIESETNLN